MSSFSICFETDMTVIASNHMDKSIDKTKDLSYAYGDDSIPNKDAFTISNILNFKTQIIPTDKIEDLQNDYISKFPNIKLRSYDIKIYLKLNTILEFDKIACIILFTNGVYGLHFICNIDNIDAKKKYIIEDIIKKYKSYNHTIQNHSSNKFVLLTNTFNIDGKIETSTFENIE